MERADYLNKRNESITELLSCIAPVGASYAAGLISDARGDLFAEEEYAMGRAIPTRRAEYLAGRYYAREAMIGLGVPPSAIPLTPSREPMWPLGTVGSIGHAASRRVAIVARAREFPSVGIDIDSEKPLHESILGIIRAPDELRASVQFGKLRFVCKEAFYKMYFPTTHHFLDFQDVDVSLDLMSGRFTITLSNHSRALNGDRTFHGSFGSAAGLYIAVAWLPA